jgi:TetR/AcrR family transcriptional regulator, copper-responsive repressor
LTKIIGRPRGFDIDEAVRKAQKLFWRQGYDGTSLAALADAIGVHKPSLYAAYGDKRDLYLAAFDAYQTDAAKLVARALGRPKFREALATFFDADIALFLADKGRGCFLLTTAIPLASNDKDMAERVRKSLGQLRLAMNRRVEQASEDGELSAAMDPATAADVIVSTHFALGNRARSGEGRAALRATARRLIDLVCAA